MRRIDSPCVESRLAERFRSFSFRGRDKLRPCYDLIANIAAEEYGHIELVMVDDQTARAMVGYLLVWGGTHIVAYVRALEKLTGADLGKLLPVPDISNQQFPEARKLQDEKKLHQVLYRFSPEGYREISAHASPSNGIAGGGARPRSA